MIQQIPQSSCYMILGFQLPNVRRSIKYCVEAGRWIVWTSIQTICGGPFYNMMLLHPQGRVILDRVYYDVTSRSYR
jgi:hypothetical protein